MKSFLQFVIINVKHSWTAFCSRSSCCSGMPGFLRCRRGLLVSDPTKLNSDGAKQTARLLAVIWAQERKRSCISKWNILHEEHEEEVHRLPQVANNMQMKAAVKTTSHLYCKSSCLMQTCLNQVTKTDKLSYFQRVQSCELLWRGSGG